jgi:colanic acid/amylovoran biosynthesis protein
LEQHTTFPAPESLAVIVNCWSDVNKGDAAITIGVLNALKENRVAARYSVVSYIFHPDEQSTRHSFRHVLREHPDVDIQQPSVPAHVRSVGRLKGFLLAIRGIVKLIAPSLIRDDGMESAIRKSSLVISNGGLYFGFVKSDYAATLYHLYSFCYPMLFAFRINVPFVLYAQSFGPFHNGITRRWMRWLLRASSGNWARESISEQLLLSIGAPPSTTRTVADAAFAVLPNSADNHVDFDSLGLGKGSFVAVSVRQLSPTGHGDLSEQMYFDSIVATIEQLVERTDLIIGIVSHTQGPVIEEDDRIASQRVFTALTAHAQQRTRVVNEDLSPSDLALVYGRAELVIATRFHAAVLAICGGAPVIAIPYFGTKAQGAFRDIGIEDLLLEVQDISPQLLYTRAMDCLNRRTELRERIRHVARAQYENAMQTGAWTAQIARGREARGMNGRQTTMLGQARGSE